MYRGWLLDHRGGSTTPKLDLGGGPSGKLKKNLVEPPMAKERRILSISNKMEEIHLVKTKGHFYSKQIFWTKIPSYFN
jgi:hypothetical protein